MALRYRQKYGYNTYSNIKERIKKEMKEVHTIGVQEFIYACFKYKYQARKYYHKILYYCNHISLFSLQPHATEHFLEVKLESYFSRFFHIKEYFAYTEVQTLNNVSLLYQAFSFSVFIYQLACLNPVDTTCIICPLVFIITYFQLKYNNITRIKMLAVISIYFVFVNIAKENIEIETYETD